MKMNQWLVMAGLAARLHAKNRIWLGESGYAWLLARLIAALGEDFREALADPEVAQDFGAAYPPAPVLCPDPV